MDEMKLKEKTAGAEEKYRILVINPGSTSTKVAVYENEKELFSENAIHSQEALQAYGNNLILQLPLRMKVMKEILEDNEIDLTMLSAVVGRGGMIPGLKTGGYYADETLCQVVREGALTPHASNLGALMAKETADLLHIPAYIYDAVSAADLPELATVTGIPEIRRQSYCHVLNSRAMAMEYARQQGKKYEEMRLLVAHLGGGISVSAHAGGKIIDVITDDGGPFSPERCGSIPLTYIVDMCFSGNYTKEEVVRKMRGRGGLVALLGTSDCREIERRIRDGDSCAAQIYQAQAYQIAKGIGELTPALESRMDAIILTGGLAWSKKMTGMVKKYVERIAPVVVMPGEKEMEALALGALRILRGQEQARRYRAARMSHCGTTLCREDELNNV